MAEVIAKIIGEVIVRSFCACCLQKRVDVARVSAPESSPLMPIPGQLSECTEEERALFAAKVLSINTFAFLCTAGVTGTPFISEDIHGSIHSYRQTFYVCAAGFLLILLVLRSRARLPRESPLYPVMLFALAAALGTCFQGIMMEVRASLTDAVLTWLAVILTNVSISFIAAARLTVFAGALPYAVVLLSMAGTGLVAHFVIQDGKSCWFFLVFLGVYLLIMVHILQSIVRGTRVYALHQHVAAAVETLFWAESP